MRHAITRACLCTRLKHWRRAKKALLVWLRKLQDVWQIARLKQQGFYFSLSVKHKNRMRKACVFICYFIGSVVKIASLEAATGCVL